MQVVQQTNIEEYPLLARGKVRDIYEIDAQTLLIVTTDRMSAFDVIMQEPIPYKGVVLNQITLFWMQRFASLVNNHLLEWQVERFPEKLQARKSELEGRSVLVRKAKPLAMECIVRGSLAGSGWDEYRKTGCVGSLPVPPGLQESSELPGPLFTPSTKAELGQHDENLSREQAVRLVGEDMFRKAEELSVSIFTRAREYAASRGIIIADTKFEFGLVDGELILIDEVLTPDCSRFWPAQGFMAGRPQPSYDKQYLRDWLSRQPWDKTPPPPALTAEVIEQTSQKYREAYASLTGNRLSL